MPPVPAAPLPPTGRLLQLEEDFRDVGEAWGNYRGIIDGGFFLNDSIVLLNDFFNGGEAEGDPNDVDYHHYFTFEADMDPVSQESTTEEAKHVEATTTEPQKEIEVEKAIAEVTEEEENHANVTESPVDMVEEEGEVKAIEEVYIHKSII